MVGNIFGSDYENSGDILSVNNGILLNNQNLSYSYYNPYCFFSKNMI